MRNAVFTLIPFHWPEKPPPALTGCLAIANDTLRIEYDLDGLNHPVDLSAPSPNPARRLQLWQHTCFELLWGPLHHPNYWEINASPAGDWNVFSFTDYRHGMTEEPRIADVQLSSQRRPHGLSLSCTVPIADLEHAGPCRRDHPPRRRTAHFLGHASPWRSPRFSSPAILHPRRLNTSQTPVFLRAMRVLHGPAFPPVHRTPPVRHPPTPAAAARR